MSRPATDKELEKIWTICKAEASKQCIPNVFEIEHGLRPGESILLSGKHELGHLKKSIELDYDFNYLRVMKRIFFMKDNYIVTGTLTNKAYLAFNLSKLRMSYQTGFLSVSKFGSSSNELKEIVLSGIHAFWNYPIDNVLSRQAQNMYKYSDPRFYTPDSVEFSKKAFRNDRSDERLYQLLENPTLSNVLNDSYKSIGAFFNSEHSIDLKKFELIDSEEQNIKNATDITLRSLESLYKEIIEESIVEVVKN